LLGVVVKAVGCRPEAIRVLASPTELVFPREVSTTCKHGVRSCPQESNGITLAKLDVELLPDHEEKKS
jgi:hypothetical protein